MNDFKRAKLQEIIKIRKALVEAGYIALDISMNLSGIETHIRMVPYSPRSHDHIMERDAKALEELA